MTLDDYFKLIVKPTETKEPTMFDVLKAHFTSLWTQPVKFVSEPEPNPEPDEDFWSFEMYTGKWEDFDGEEKPAQWTVISEPSESTWMDQLDTILDVMSKHYGYDIKEQVYYSVQFPLNTVNYYTGEPLAGYGRCLNDEKLQLLLLSHPELYEPSDSKEQ